MKISGRINDEFNKWFLANTRGIIYNKQKREFFHTSRDGCPQLEYYYMMREAYNLGKESWAKNKIKAKK